MIVAEDLRKLKNSAAKTRTQRAKADAAWADHKSLICSVYSNGELSLQAIADVTGVTKARVWQIVTSYGGK